MTTNELLNLMADVTLRVLNAETKLEPQLRRAKDQEEYCRMIAKELITNLSNEEIAKL